MNIVDETYLMIDSFPSHERFNLASQLIRCSVSIPSNIAEGTSKATDKHLNTYIGNSLGSAFEWETQLIIAYRRNYIDQERFKVLEDKIQQLQRMISGFQDGLHP